MAQDRLVIFVENLYGGGVEKVLQTILRYIDYRKFEVTLYSNRLEVIDYSIFPKSIDYRHVFDSISETESFVRGILKRICNRIKLHVYYHYSPKLFYSFFIRGRYDIGIAFIEGYSTRILSGAPSSMRKIAWVHTDLVDNPWTRVAYRYSSEEQKSYNKINRIVCVSEKVQKVMRDSYYADGRTVILKNPIEREKIIELASIPLPSEFEKNNCIRIVSIGSLIPIKGFDRLLKVFCDIHSLDRNLELIIIGKGPLEKELKSLVHYYDLDGSVHFTGYLHNPYPILRSADIYVCSSYAEGYNTAITEALILGRPIVSTICSGVQDQLGYSEFGIVVDNDTSSLFEGIRKMVSNKDLRNSYSMMAFERGMSFSFECVMDQIEELLTSA